MWKSTVERKKKPMIAHVLTPTDPKHGLLSTMKKVFQAWMGSEDSFAIGDDQSPAASALFMASDFPCHQ